MAQPSVLARGAGFFDKPEGALDGAESSGAIRGARFVLGLLPVPLTLAFQLALWTSTIRPFGLFLFVQAVYLSSWIGGLYAGLISTFASAVVAFYFFVPPERGWRAHDPKYLIDLLLFVVLGIVICLFHDRLRRATRALQRTKEQLESVSEASMSIAESITTAPRESVDAVLQTIASQAQVLTGAEYVAVGLGTDPDKPFEPFAFVGISAEQAAAIGRHPRLVGVLGIAAAQDGLLHLRDVRRHPAHRGFPKGHPSMSSFLGIPIRHRDRIVGQLYLSNKRGADDFTDTDRTVVEMLAARAGLALEMAHHYEAQLTARAWFEAVIEQLPDPVVLLDARGHIETVNRAAKALCRAEECRRDPLGNIIPLDLRLPNGDQLPPDEIPYVRAFARGETSFGVNLRIRKASGELLPVSANNAPLRGPSGELTGAIALFRDVSAEKDLARMREEWSALIAHDLRQPVGVIGLAADMVRRTHQGPIADGEAKQIERIRGANRRLTQMIDELLDVTRLESNQLTIVPREIDVAGTARELCEKMANITSGHPVSVCESCGPHVAWADSNRVEQVMANLLSNACKYGASDTEVRLDVESRGDQVEVTVTNHGRGIPADEMPQLFQRFMRSAASRTSGTAGIGLGLYICKGLVEAQGGRIWAESTPGDTTSFHFTLPRCPAGYSNQRSPADCRQ